MEEFHSLQISAGLLSVADNVAVCCIELLQSFGRSFKPITWRSLSVLSIVFVIVVVSVLVQGILPGFFIKKLPSWSRLLLFWLRQQDTKQDQSSVKFCLGDRVYWRLCASVITTYCDFHRRVFSIPWVLCRFVYWLGLKYSRIFPTWTWWTFTFRFFPEKILRVMWLLLFEGDER